MTRSSATAEKQRVRRGELALQSTPPPPSGYTYVYGRIRNPQQTYMYVKRAVRKAHFKLNRAFKVIQGYSYLCRQEPRAVYCRNHRLRGSGSAVVTMTSKVNGKTEILTPCRSETPENIEAKLGMIDYVMDPYNLANFGGNRSKGSAPHIGEI